MKMTNRWNRSIYRLWAPVYDTLMEGLFRSGHKRAMDLLALQPGERVLLVGVGTGADLLLLPSGVQAVGIDLSPAMLARAWAKLPLPGRDVSLIQGDAQQLLVDESSFDAIIFNLILSVIPDGSACLRENLRAMKSGGRAVIFDKFLSENGNISPRRRALNYITTLFGTDITRKFDEINAGSGWKVIEDEPSLLRGMYRVILLRKDYIPTTRNRRFLSSPVFQAVGQDNILSYGYFFASAISTGSPHIGRTSASTISNPTSSRDAWA
jgi:phosphatidylethanolamine/phosphatidyl-N-methylethanolamine N-methyltransferase